MSISSISSLLNPSSIFSTKAAASGSTTDISQILQQQDVSQSSPRSFGDGTVDKQKFLDKFSQIFGSDAAADVTNPDGSIDFSKVKADIDAKIASLQSSQTGTGSTTGTTTTANASSTPAVGGGHHHKHGGGGLMGLLDQIQDAESTTASSATTATTATGSLTASSSTTSATSTSSTADDVSSALASIFGSAVSVGSLVSIVA